MPTQIKLVVDSINVVDAFFDIELHNQVTLTTMRYGITGPPQQVCGFIQVQMQGNRKSQSRLFCRMVFLIRLNFGEVCFGYPCFGIYF